MKLAYEPRASAILYHLLTSRADRRPFLLPANICPIVPITFLKSGVDFEFVDLDPATLHMDLECAYDQLSTGKFGGLLYAHTYGESSTPQGFFSAAKALDDSLLLVDDRCLCPPDGQPDAEIACDAALYSTGYAKVVDLGYGGYAFLRSETPYQRRSLPFDPAALEAVESGYKAALASRLPFHYTDSPWLETDRDLPSWLDYCQALARALPPAMQHRQAINAIYHDKLPAEIQLPAPYQQWRFHILVPDSQRVLRAIFAAGLFASTHYASLAGIFSPGLCPETEKLAFRVVNLFNDRHYSVEMAEQTCKIILENLSR